MMQQTWDSRSIDPRDRVETIRTMLCENLVQTDLTLDPQGREAHVNVSYQDIGQLRALSVKTVPSLACLLYTSPSPRDRQKSRMPSSA